MRYTDPKDELAYQLDLAIQRGAISEEKALRFMDEAEEGSNVEAIRAHVALRIAGEDVA